MANDTLIGVDIAKTLFQVALTTTPGMVAKRQRLKTAQFQSFLVHTPPAVVVMEACGSAHFWARYAEAQGHRVVLLPPHQVRPYVLRNKTDRTDADGILEAHRNAEIRPVPVKTLTQQGIGSLHRLRAAWMHTRVARLNTARGLLRELGVFIPVGATNVVPHLREAIGDADGPVPDMLRAALAELADEIGQLDNRIEAVEHQLTALARRVPVVKRLLTIPGIGIITATALYAFVGSVDRFPSARHLASYLGLTPREYSSGSRRRLGRISKRGDTYLRTLLIHGARAVLARARQGTRPDHLRAWAADLDSRVGHNKAAVALANKITRTVWRIWRDSSEYVSAAA